MREKVVAAVDKTIRNFDKVPSPLLRKVLEMVREQFKQDSSWPSHQEELSRKVLEQLQERVFQLDQGEITKRELSLIIDSLYHSITGLVPWEVAELLAKTQKDLCQ